jgi:hypothetical protein
MPPPAWRPPLRGDTLPDEPPRPKEPATRSAANAATVMSSLYSDTRERTRRVRRVLGFVAGLVLFVAAIVAVLGNAQPISVAFDKLAGGAWWLFPAMMLLPLVHFPLTGAVFWAATPPDQSGRPRVGLMEMTALITTGNLANYLPLRPGMVARIAYHRAVNGIPVVESARILGSVLAAGLMAAALFLVAALAAQRSAGGVVPGLPAAVLLLPIAIGLLACVYFRGSSGLMTSSAARWWMVLVLRYVDLGVWAIRYGVAFWAVGVPLSPAQAALYAVVANVAMLIPLAGNGLGIREWVVGLVGPMLPAAVLGASTLKQQGLTADLLNRAAEIAVSVVVGSIAAGWITRHVRRRAVGSLGANQST